MLPTTIIANWKMHKSVAEAADFIAVLKKADVPTDRELVICPPFTSLKVAQVELEGSAIQYGAQNMHWEADGAYTGEISAGMLKEFGCTYVIIGHSERRLYFNETNETVNKKVLAALAAGLTPIVCVGETLEQRQHGESEGHVKVQVNAALLGIENKDYQRVIMAYEPIWAIGTGETATPQQVQEMHHMIRSLVGEPVRIVYGGSVNAANATELMGQLDVNGALVGGASLDAIEFARIANC